MFHVEHPPAQPAAARRPHPPDRPPHQKRGRVAANRPMTTPELERRQVAERIARRAAQAGLELDSLLLEALTAYVDLLMRWNRRINLTALSDDDRGIDRLVIEPLVAAQRLPAPGIALTDIGSGGGSPALPMKLAAPSIRLRMVEARTRKAAFLREAVRHLRLEGAAVEACRYEGLVNRAELVGKADVVSVRAVRAGALMLRQVQPLVRTGGAVFLFRNTREELGAIPPPWRMDAAYPLLDPDNRLVVLRKCRSR